MGLFDQVHYEGRIFQMKDFDCTMHDYYIEDGRLLESVGYTEDRSEATKWKNEHPGEQLPKSLQGLSGMYGCCAWVETGKRDLNFHGCLNFYTANYHGKMQPSGEWEEYNAKFIEGVLVEAVRVPVNK